MKTLVLAGIVGSLGTAQYASRVAEGRSVFLQNCQACHGPAAMGNGVAPDLHPIARLLAAGEGHDGTAVRIKTRLAQGGDRMPAFPHLGEGDVEALLAYLQEIANDEPASVLPDSAEEESSSCPHDAAAGVEDDDRGCGCGRGCPHHAPGG